MNISILGAGRVGTHLAQQLQRTGHDVVIGHRDPARALRERGSSLRIVSLAEAAAAAPLVIHATPGDTALDTLTPLRGPLAGKVLLDVANASVRGPDGLPGALALGQRSLGEALQEALPDTRVVKGLNTMLFSVMADPASLATPPTAFLSGNDPEAKALVRSLLDALGWRADQVLDLGGIESARATEALVLMVPHVIRAKGMRPFALTVAF